MRWTSVMSSFVLRRFCLLISTGVRTDKGFKEVHLNQVARDLKEFSGNEVTGQQVYNHLRKWRQRWTRVSKLRDLSGSLWDEDNFMITLEEEHFKGHVKAHPKDADLLNKPIENYQYMEVIFGTGCATGKFAMGSSEALGSPSDFAESSLKHLEDDIGKLFEERKRSSLSDEDITIMTSMAAAVNNVADAIRETKAQDEHPDLYEAVMFMPGFSDEALIVAYSHLLDNRAQGGAFVKMNESHRVLWLKTFLAKHYSP
ncbi:hypothetical protein GQ55_7G060100 [Panicum hallii var. hallii]|uniref:Myb/SANT-like domain-containing protein n=1 Tax=Panicum hallii var. hallii TaxID=1504633 RepID=A0A2T7CSL1_9POAL|nr:hypothetical protein GQ55_7G060100 [Panicum hallii var. hallii]